MNIVKLNFKLDMDKMLINPYMIQDDEKAYKVKRVELNFKMKKLKENEISTTNN